MITTVPNGLAQIVSTFGPLTPDFEAQNITLFVLPYPLLYGSIVVTHARCHRLAVDNFVKAFTDLQAAGLQHQNATDEYGGIYAYRNIKGSSHISTHALGIAIDMDPSEYPLGSSNRMPQDVIDIWTGAGFFYGGDFSGRKDPMHLQLCTGY